MSIMMTSPICVHARTRAGGCERQRSAPGGQDRSVRHTHHSREPCPHHTPESAPAYTIYQPTSQPAQRSTPSSYAYRTTSLPQITSLTHPNQKIDTPIDPTTPAMMYMTKEQQKRPQPRIERGTSPNLKECYHSWVRKPEGRIIPLNHRGTMTT